MRQADLSFTVSQHKLACVLDPTLVLAHAQGPALALRLTRVLEPWLTRSFWHVIDASDLLYAPALRDSTTEPPNEAAVAGWIALRDSNDASSWLLRWIGDNHAESQLRDSSDAAVIERYEMLADALAHRSERASEPRRRWASVDPAANAIDALALSATLDGALILGEVPASGAPWPVQALDQAGLEATALIPMPADTVFAAERQLLRSLLAGAGLAALLARLPRLAVVHVATGTQATAASVEDGAHAADPWAGARAWWYEL
jgi:hypothetical protein